MNPEAQSAVSQLTDLNHNSDQGFRASRKQHGWSWKMHLCAEATKTSFLDVPLIIPSCTDYTLVHTTHASPSIYLMFLTGTTLDILVYICRVLSTNTIKTLLQRLQAS